MLSHHRCPAISFLQLALVKEAMLSCYVAALTQRSGEEHAEKGADLLGRRD